MFTGAQSPACPHHPPCPAAAAAGCAAARTVAAHPEQVWSLLCSDVVVCDDTGQLLLDGPALPPGVCHTGYCHDRCAARRPSPGPKQQQGRPERVRPYRRILWRGQALQVLRGQLAG
jgi:hypothetical protein